MGLLSPLFSVEWCCVAYFLLSVVVLSPRRAFGWCLFFFLELAPRGRQHDHSTPEEAEESRTTPVNLTYLNFLMKKENATFALPPLWQRVRHLLPSWSGVNPPPSFGGSSSLLPGGGPSPCFLGRMLGCWVWGRVSDVRLGVGWLGGWVSSWGLGGECRGVRSFSIQ